MQATLRLKKQAVKKTVVFRRALQAKGVMAAKVPALTKAQHELYDGIAESGLFTLESTKDSFAGVTRLRDAVEA